MAGRISRALEAQGFRVHAFAKPAHLLEEKDLKTQGMAIAAITIGGDGTLRGAVERLLKHAHGDPAKVPPILVVPLGTANLMSQHLGIRWDEKTIGDAVAECIATRHIVNLDAARANDRLFLLMVGVGIDAAIVHELDRLR